MRVLRLAGVVAVGIGLLGALGVGLVSAWAVSGGQPAARPGPTRTDPPAGLGGDLPPRLQVEIEPSDVGSLDREVRVRNPNARPVSGVRVVVEVEGGTCEWPDGRFPSPLGLAPAGSTSRTCHVVPRAAAGTSVVDVVVHVGSHRVASSSDVIAHPLPASPLDPRSTVEGPAAVVGSSGGGPAASPRAAPQPTGQSIGPPLPMAPPCPHLVDGPELGASPALAGLGPALTDRARLLDPIGCAEWASMAGLRVVRTRSPELCPAWEVHLDGGPVAARLSGPQVPGCPTAPLEVEVWGQPTDVAARVATLAAWALEGPGSRAAELHRAAATGTGLPCAVTSAGSDSGAVALGHAYEQRVDGGRTYRVTVRLC